MNCVEDFNFFARLSTDYEVFLHMAFSLL
uniref:Uncharacterized protein n=1 Tax=Rhizophora mucronata TaxID=61149 RepID=A0A2P2QYC5_RHIMU